MLTLKNHHCCYLGTVAALAFVILGFYAMGLGINKQRAQEASWYREAQHRLTEIKREKRDLEARLAEWNNPENLLEQASVRGLGLQRASTDQVVVLRSSSKESGREAYYAWNDFRYQP